MKRFICWLLSWFRAPEPAPPSRFPIISFEAREYYVCNRGECPDCGGSLDTGWECNKCAHDHKAIALLAERCN